MPSQKSLVFFIPDIMGSSLNVKYTNSFGQEENREVWTTDMEKNIDLFSYFPRFFEPVHKSFILTQEVITHFERIRLPSSPDKLIVYNFLLEFLRQEYQHKFNSFSYNWFRDNRENAKLLAYKIKEKISDNSEIFLIAHGMGGIITRLMLLENQDIAIKTKVFFQIATPVKGFAKAYYAFKYYTVLLPVLEKMWQGKNNLLEDCPALYQMLPPSDTLYTQGGEGYSALSTEAWSLKHSSYLDAAKDVHDKLKESERLMDIIDIICIYSNYYHTPIHYLFDPNKDNIIQEFSSLVRGDGMVTCASAYAYTQPDKRFIITSPPCGHWDICQNPEVYDIIRKHIKAAESSPKHGTNKRHYHN